MIFLYRIVWTWSDHIKVHLQYQMTLRMKLKNIRRLYEKCSKRVGWQRLFMKEIIKQIICKFKSFRFTRNIRKGSYIIFCGLLWCLEKTGCHTINFDVFGNRGTPDIICATAERGIQVTLLSKSKSQHYSGVRHPYARRL